VAFALMATVSVHRIVTPSAFKQVDVEGASKLYEVVTNTSDYASGPVMLLDLHGSRSEQGFAFGRMGAQAALENYDSLIGALIDVKTLRGKAERAALELVIDWQWKSVLSQQVPAAMADELDGFAKGCTAALGSSHARFCEHASSRIILLANMPGDVSDIVFVLLDELPLSVTRAAEALLGDVTLAEFLRRLPWPPAMCSMWAAWGSRTDGGRLLSGRNLDWNHDTGIDRHKLVTVYHPPEPGLFAHATFGFGGLVGALAGVSAAGLTVHEANLESNIDSFRGFPWLLRLRHIMEHASSLKEARALWEATNNTVGFNHMVASAADGGAIVMETNARTTAFFEDNDAREAGASLPGPGRAIKGAPLKGAVWRTNHGFDPRIVQHFMWNKTHAYNDSDTRYHLIHDALVAAAADATQPLLNASGAVGVTALVGQKGPSYSTCAAPFQGGSNVLSVAFDPTARTAYSAWEDGAGAGAQPGNWRPAACNAYLQFELRSWFGMARVRPA